MAKILFFAPHSFIWVYTFPEALVAESLMKSEHDIVYITCGEALSPACICLTMRGIHPDSPDTKRAQVCQQCTSRADLIRQEMKFPGYSMSSVKLPEDEEKVESAMAGLSPANFSDFKIENVPVGRIAAYEFLIRFKKMNADLSENEWQQFLPILKSAVKTFYIAQRILEKEKPDYVISYQSLYSVNAVFTHLAKSKGITPYCLCTGSNFSSMLGTLVFSHESTMFYSGELIKRWNMVKNEPCNKGLLTEVTEHFLELLRGKSVFVYSAAKSKSEIDLRKKFGILQDQKILVATMSSYDELFAADFVGAWPKAEKVLFKTQADWIKALLLWAKDKPEYFLIIRVHPREFPNKRETVKSQHAVMIQQLLVDLPGNVKVNWPEDGLSLYDLACEADVFLNAWSSVGAEMPLLGLPVVVYSKQIFPTYPTDLNYLGETEDQYFNQIEQAIKDGWNFERIRKSYRWYATMFGRSQVRIDDSYVGHMKPVIYKNIFQRKIAGVKRRVTEGVKQLFPLIQEWQDCRRRSAELKFAGILDQIFSKNLEMSFDAVNSQSGPVPTLGQETALIKQEMVRIAEVMWGGMDKPQEEQKGKLFLQFKNCLTV